MRMKNKDYVVTRDRYSQCDQEHHKYLCQYHRRQQQQQQQHHRHHHHQQQQQPQQQHHRLSIKSIEKNRIPPIIMIYYMK